MSDELTTDSCILPFIHVATDPAGQQKLCCSAAPDNSAVSIQTDGGLWNSEFQERSRQNFWRGSGQTSVAHAFGAKV